MKLKKVILCSTVMMGIFTSTASFAASAGWSGRLPGNHANIYTSTVTKSTNDRTPTAIATSVPNSGINVWVQKNTGSAALAATSPKSIMKKNVTTKMYYHSYYNSGQRLLGGIENKSSGPLGTSKGTINFK